MDGWMKVLKEGGRIDIKQHHYFSDPDRVSGTQDMDNKY
jgi:hypothetical protein